MLRGTTTITFWAADVAAAREWYTEALGIAPHFQIPNADHPEYVEFRVGDDQDELGLNDARHAPPGGVPATPGGAIVYWHVDDVAAAIDRLVARGARIYQPITPHEAVISAAVTDPFGNIIGLMFNPHYLAVLAQSGAG